MNEHVDGVSFAEHAKALHEQMVKELIDLVLDNKISEQDYKRLTGYLNNIIYNERMDVNEGWCKA